MEGGDWWYMGSSGWWCVEGREKEGELGEEGDKGTGCGWDTWGMG